MAQCYHASLIQIPKLPVASEIGNRGDNLPYDMRDGYIPDRWLEEGMMEHETATINLMVQ